MKRLLTAAVALSILGGAAASAQPYPTRSDQIERRADRLDRRADQLERRADQLDRKADRQERREYRRWARGERLPSQYRTRGYYVDYRRAHLRQPPRGHQWVRVNDQYLLVALATGLISQMVVSR